MEEVPIQKPLNKQVLMTGISPDHPNFLLMKNFQEVLNSGKEIPLSWIRSGCLYQSPYFVDMFKTHLHIALTERLILFGKDPTPILQLELDSLKLMRLSESNRHQLERAFINKLLTIYQIILRS